MLASLAASDEGMAAIVAAEGPGYIVAVLDCHVDNVVVAHSACLVLWSVACSDAGRLAIVSATGVPVLVAVLTRHAGVASFANFVCSVLCNTAAHITLGLDADLAARCASAIIAALTCNEDDAALAATACRALLAVAREAGIDAVLAAGGAAVLVSVLIRHAGVADVAPGACAALYFIAKNNDSGRALLLLLGAPMAIVDVWSRHGGELDLICECALQALDPANYHQISAARAWLRRRRPHGGVAGVCAYDCCGAVGTLFCSKCLRTLYCSKACQVADWLPTGQHRAECRAMREEAAKLAEAAAVVGTLVE